MEQTRKRKREEACITPARILLSAKENVEFDCTSLQGSTPKPTHAIHSLQTLTESAKSLKASKTPKAKAGRRSIGNKEVLWCCDCADEAGAGCAVHERLDVPAARQRAAAALRRAQEALLRLDELDRRWAPRLRCTVAVKGDLDYSETADMEVTLATSRLSADERRALCAYLENLELVPEEAHLSAPSAGCEAIATKCAKLPDRLDGVTLKAGAILLLGAFDRDDSLSSLDGDEDMSRSWIAESPPALRIYYGRRVQAHQGRGAKVLGYVTRGLKLLASARPADHDSPGLLVEFSGVRFDSD